MKRTAILLSFAVIICLFVAPSKSYAQKMPVYSANGFQCSSAPLPMSKLSLISCSGKFPKMKGNIDVSGWAGVNITYGENNNVYSYSSHTGCLMHATPKSIAATDRKGKTKKFSAGDFDSATQYCGK